MTTGTRWRSIARERPLAVGFAAFAMTLLAIVAVPLP